jgi:hypothetical protein
MTSCEKYKKCNTYVNLSNNWTLKCEDEDGVCVCVCVCVCV